MFYPISACFISQVVATFQRMRQEQRSLASKAAELEMDINEHRYIVNIPPVHSAYIPNRINQIAGLINQFSCSGIFLSLFSG